MNKIPLIIDNDAGSDDALALLMVHAAKNIDLKAITVVAGNVNINVAKRNVLKIADFAGIDVPIAIGTYPIMKEFIPCDVACLGAEGLAGAVLPETDRKPVATNAVELLYAEAAKANGALQILATGPLSNIALLIATYPDVRNLIAHITIMGGAIDGGNATPAAEFNIFTDPEAAKIVFQSGIPLTMIGLDVSYKTQVLESEIATLVAHDNKISKFVGELMWYPPEEGYVPIPEDGWPIFDALAAAAVIDRDMMEYGFYYGDVETKGEFTYGKTVIDDENLLKKQPNVYVATKCDKQKFVAMLENTVAFFD